MKCSDCNGDFDAKEFQRSRGTTGAGKPAKPRIVPYCRECGKDRRSAGRTTKRYGVPEEFQTWAKCRVTVQDDISYGLWNRRIELSCVD